MNEKPDTLLEFAQQVAEALGHGWTAHGVNGNNARAIIENPNTTPEGIAAFYVGCDHCWWERSDRVEVTGRYPGYKGRPVLNSYEDDFPRITCAVDRGAEAVAREIERRFLPRYWPLAEKALELAAHYERENATAGEAARDIAEIVGGEVSVDGQRLLDTPSVRFSKDGGGNGRMYGKMEVHGDEVNLDMSGVPVALAERIAAEVARYYYAAGA